MAGEPVATHGVAVYGDYGMTCSCGELIRWPLGWSTTEQAARRLVAIHAAPWYVTAAARHEGWDAALAAATALPRCPLSLPGDEHHVHQSDLAHLAAEGPKP